MGLVKRKPKALHAAPARDLGPEVRLARGDVVKETRIDPAIAGRIVEIRAGRVRDTIHTLMMRNYITARAFAAVEAFRDDVAIAQGARVATSSYSSVSSTTPSRWPPERQLDALIRVRQTLQALPDRARRTAQAVIVHGYSLDRYARETRIRRQAAQQALQDALQVIETRYGPRIDAAALKPGEP